MVAIGARRCESVVSRTTKLYDPRNDETSLDEYEKVGI
jgi:hypothetical protein